MSAAVPGTVDASARPADHPLRRTLNDEVHARPPTPLRTPARVSYIALLSDGAGDAAARTMVGDLAGRYPGVYQPPPEASHYSADLGPFQVIWEKHSEFQRYTFVVESDGAHAFDQPAIRAVPADWLGSLDGETVMAAHVAVLRENDIADTCPPDRVTHQAEIAERFFRGNLMLGADVTGRRGTSLSDFRIHADGFSRFVIVNRALNAYQTGRMVQRLLEMDTYRILALMALPLAQKLTPFLTERERELARIAAALSAPSGADEQALLERLTGLAAEIETTKTETSFRFDAAAAYYGLVRARIHELREDRIEGLQTFEEFTERRLAPAMNTCAAVSDRQESLSARMSRATQLLSTRVDIQRQTQNRALLQSMNNRARLQLRLQETVEGLSTAAITYYVVGLIGYGAEALTRWLPWLDPKLAMGLSIPVVGGLIWAGVRRARRRLMRDAA